jgi:hypothetical protein
MTILDEKLIGRGLGAIRGIRILSDNFDMDHRMRYTGFGTVEGLLREGMAGAKDNWSMYRIG